MITLEVFYAGVDKIKNLYFNSLNVFVFVSTVVTTTCK